MQQNELFFGAKYEVNAAKRTAFWCKTQGKMVLNAVRFAAKCKAESINIHRNVYK